MLKKIISLVLSFTLITSQPIFAQGVAQINLGNYMRAVGSSMAMDKFRPLHMRYFSYDIGTDNFQLLLDKGDNKDIKEGELEEKTKVLMDYFKIGLSLPNEKFWVNLRPDAQDQIIDPELERTDIGKIMLEADLQLKKDTSGMTSPQTPEGKAYWEKLYKKAGELFGTENITIPTITRPWIVPGEIILRQGEDSAYIFKANMKVMLEHDYLNSQSSGQNFKPLTSNYNFSDPRMKELNEYSSQLIRELIIPKLTKEVNTSKRYASLRRVFFSLVMARWFKDTFGSFGSASAPGTRAPDSSYIKLIDSGDLTNLTSQEAWSKTYYFNEYKKSFEKGEYNLKEEITTPTGQVIRSYVSGGVSSAIMTQKPKGFYKGKHQGFYKDKHPLNVVTGGYENGKFTIQEYYGFSNKGVNTKKRSSSSAIDNKLSEDFIKFGMEELINRRVEEICRKIGKDAWYVKEIVNTFWETRRIFPTAEQAQEIIGKSFQDKRGLTVSNVKTITEEYLSAMGEKLKNAGGMVLNQENQEQKVSSSISDAQREVLKKKLENYLVKKGLTSEFLNEKVVDKELSFYSGIFKFNGEDFYIDVYQRFVGSNTYTVTVSRLRGDDSFCNISVRPDSTINVRLGEDWDIGLLHEFTNAIIEELKKGSLKKGVAETSSSVQTEEQKYMKEVVDHLKQIGVAYGRVAKAAEKIKQNGHVIKLEEEDLNMDFLKNPLNDSYEIILRKKNSLSAQTYYIEFNSENIVRIRKEKWLRDGGDVGVGAVELAELINNALDEIVNKASSSLESPVGGIDFRQMNYLVQPMGSFKDLQFGLPTLSASALERINLDEELRKFRDMVKKGFVPSGARVKEYLAACFQKGKIEEKQDDLLVCLAEIYRLAEEENLETSPELRESLVIVDTGRFVLLPNNQKAGLN